MKKKVLAFVLALTLVSVAGLAAGCGSKNSDPLSDGVLKIGTSADYTPMEYKNKDNKIVGFDIDLGRAIAKKLKVKASFKDTDFDGIFNGLNSGQYDCIISGVSNTTARQKSFAMSDSYLGNGIVIVSRASVTPATKTSDLNGQKVGVQLGTTADDSAKNLRKDGNTMNLKEFDSMVDAFTALQGGQISYILTDKPVADFYTAQKPDVYKTTSDELSNEPIAIVCRKSDKKLRDKINKALDEIKKDGTFGKLTKKWFGEDLTNAKIDDVTKTVN